MGEWSKKIGEEGERIALKLMEITGWGNLEKGIDIPCVDNKVHVRAKEHGLDGLFLYKSPLKDRTLNNVCISVKFNNDGYPSSASTRKTKFKDHLIQLNNTIECYENSEMKVEKDNLWSGVDNSDCYGVVIWLHNDRKDNSKDDLIDEFKDIRMEGDSLDYPIALIDQKRANFIFETHKYVKEKYFDFEISFNYQRTGNNNIDDEIVNSDEILPWEMLNTGLIVYRAVKVSNDSDERNLLIMILEEFDSEVFKRLLGLAQTLSNNLANKIEIAFSLYSPVQHENSVNQVKASFEDEKFTQRVIVNSFRQDLRNL